MFFLKNRKKTSKKEINGDKSMKNNKKMIFLSIFFAFLGFCPILGMSRPTPSVSDLPEYCDSPDENCYKKPEYTSSTSSILSLFEKDSTLDVRSVITGDIPPRSAAPALEENPEKCASPEISKKKTYHRTAQQLALCLFQSEAQKNFLAQPKQSRSRKQPSAQQQKHLASTMLFSDGNDGDIDENNKDGGIVPISRLTSQTQSGSSSAPLTERKSALKQSSSFTPREKNKRSVSYSDNFSILSENNEIFIERISKTAPASQCSTPLSMEIPGQVKDECEHHHHNSFKRPVKGAFGGFFDPKPQTSRRPSVLDDFFAPRYRTNKRNPIQEFFQTDSQSAPISPKEDYYDWLDDIKEENPNTQDETSSMPQSSNRTIMQSQSAPVSPRPGSAKKMSRVKRMMNCLLLPFTKHKNHSK